MKSALIIIDLQNDFVPGGALAVPGGQEIVPVVARLTKLPFDTIVATQDWHPANHESFASQHHLKPGDVVQVEGIDQILWPTHCVQNSRGAEFVPGWDTSAVSHIVQKGTNRSVDSYSTFFDNARRFSTGLETYLRSHGIQRLFLVGLATDYCVKYSAMDAIDLGFDTYVVTDACRGINLQPGDVENSLQTIQDLGGHLCCADDVAALIG